MTDRTHGEISSYLIALSHAVNADRPLVAFDLETTGPFPNVDRIVEITAAKVQPVSWRPAYDGEPRVRVVSRLLNPGRSIPADATEVHGITDEMVKDAPRFAQVARGVQEFFTGAVLVGFYIEKFDVELLDRELRDAGLPGLGRPETIDPRALYLKRKPRTLAALHEEVLGAPLDDAHRTASDVLGTLRLLDGMLRTWPDMPIGVMDALIKECDMRPENRLDPDAKVILIGGVPILNFSQEHKGKPLADVDSGFIRWVIKNDFSAELKDIMRAELERRA